MKKLLYITLGVLALAACQPKDIDSDQLFKSELDVTAMLNAEPKGYFIYDEANGGLNAFVDKFMSELGDFEPVRTRSFNDKNIPGLAMFSIDTIPTDTMAIYIRGRVTTDDYGGNFYKSLVIQQMVNGEQHALRISIDAGNASGLYAMGQELLIRVNGLAIGKYANQPQLCVPTFNNNLNAQNYAQKVGWAPGRIPAARFAEAVTLIGTPDKNKLYYEPLNLSTLVDTKTSGDYGSSLISVVDARKWDGKLVKIENIYFTGEYANTNGSRSACDDVDPSSTGGGNCRVFAPTTNNVGYPQSRVITDGSLYFMVSTSEYAKFAHMYLPAPEYKGSVVGILGYYYDNPSYAPTWKTWSISMRDLGDLDLSNGTQQWVPEEYSNK